MTRKSQNDTNTKPNLKIHSIHTTTVQFKVINMETRKKFVDNKHTYVWGQVVIFAISVADVCQKCCKPFKNVGFGFGFGFLFYFILKEILIKSGIGDFSSSSMTHTT